jgi:hypothetical protein
MVLAALTSKPSSRTALIKRRISALTSLISLSAFAVAAREAFLRRLAACSGAWVQQSPCDPLAGSVQRSPFAVVALHRFTCDLPFLLRGWGDGLGSLSNAATVRPSKAPPTNMKSDGLWVGLQVEEPGAVKDLGTIEMQPSNSVGE